MNDNYIRNREGKVVGGWDGNWLRDGTGKLVARYDESDNRTRGGFKSSQTALTEQTGTIVF